MVGVFTPCQPMSNLYCILYTELVKITQGLKQDDRIGNWQQNAVTTAYNQTSIKLKYLPSLGHPYAFILRQIFVFHVKGLILRNLIRKFDENQ